MRNSAKRKTKKIDQNVCDLTELGYDLRIIFMKSLYIDTNFSNSLLSNISDKVGDMIIDSDYNNSNIRLEFDSNTYNDYDILLDIIDREYINTLYQYKDMVEDILYDNDMDIPISRFPVMTNITKYGNSLNIAL